MQTVLCMRFFLGGRDVSDGGLDCISDQSASPREKQYVAHGRTLNQSSP